MINMMIKIGMMLNKKSIAFQFKFVYYKRFALTSIKTVL